MEKFYNKHIKAYLEDDLFVVIGIFLFAFFLRLLFLPHLFHDPAFLHPIIDCKEHNDLAFQILNYNDWRIDKFWYHTPGYGYFIAVIYKILGHSVVRLAIVQYMLGSLSACLLYVMIKRLINRWAALFGAFLMCVFWFFIYAQSHVYSENLSMIFNLLMVYFLLFNRETWRKYLLGGFMLGLSILVRPEMLPFAGVFIIWLFVKRSPVSKIILYYLLFILGVAFCILPLMLRNYNLSGNFMIREQMGVNFYMGSMPEYKGSNIYIPIGVDWTDITKLPYQKLNVFNRNLSEKELNQFYFNEVKEYASANPAKWLSFMAGKIFSVLIGIDFLRGEDVYFYEKYIRSTPLQLIQTWLISILALIGIFLSFREEGRKYSLLYLFLGSYIFAMFFTYKTRYLVSHMPLLIVFSSYTAAVLIKAVRYNENKKLISIVCAAALLYGCVKWNPLDIVWPGTSEVYYVIGLDFGFEQNFLMAEKYYLKAIETDPQNYTAHRELGVLYLQMGLPYKAFDYFSRAEKLQPREEILGYKDMALWYTRHGGIYQIRNTYDPAFVEYIDNYFYHFRYPYDGPVYQGEKK